MLLINMTKNCVFFPSVAFLLGAALFFDISSVSADTVSGIVDVNDIERTVDPSVSGANVLFMNHDDNERGPLPGVIAELGCQNLRYPGGELADNYVWSTNSVENPDLFPYEQPDDPQKRMDFDEFMQEVAAVLPSSATLTLVVNLEGALSQWRDDEKHGIQKRWRYHNWAVSWLEKVKNSYPEWLDRIYWEIGNESYFKDTRYSLSGRQYGEAVVYFAQGMRQVHPQVKILALGPWTTTSTSFIDSLGADGDRAFNRLFHDKDRFANEADMKAYVSTRTDAQLRAELCGGTCPPSNGYWWDIVLPIVHDHIYAVSPHRYSFRYSDGSANFQREDLVEFRRVREVHTLAKQFNPAIKLALTEFNLGGQGSVNLNRVEQAIAFAELHLGYIGAGADILNAWPFAGNGAHRRTHIVAQGTYEKTALARYFQMFRLWGHLDLARLDWSTQGERRIQGIVLRHSFRRNQAMLYLVNKDTQPHTVVLRGLPPDSRRGNAYLGTPSSSDPTGFHIGWNGSLVNVNAANRELTVTNLPGYSIIRIVFKFPTQPARRELSTGINNSSYVYEEPCGGDDIDCWTTLGIHGNVTNTGVER